MRLKLIVRNGTSVYIKNMGIKQLSNHFAMAFRVRKLIGTPWSQRFFLIFLLFATRVHRFVTL